VQSQVLAAGGGVNVDQNKMMQQERAQHAEREVADEKVELLIKEKERLEAEIEEVTEQMGNSGNHDAMDQLCEQEAGLKEELELINAQIERENMNGGEY
jgi:hypothetical protein